MKLKRKNHYGVKGYPPEIIAAIHRDFLALGTLTAVAAKYDRSISNIRTLLHRRGLYIPNPERAAFSLKRKGKADGRFTSYPRLTSEQIENLIAGMRVFRLPGALRHEWRSWPMERKAWLIGRLREKFRNPQRDQPTTPLSANVEPFDYTSPRAWEILRKTNVDATGKPLPSRQWKLRLFPNSWGLIWNEQLWFWVPYNGTGEHGGSYQFGKYQAGVGRPALHREIWVSANGRPIPACHVVRFKDDNSNNLDPKNLYLADRNTVCRENQAAALQRKSRELTSLLLKRSQQKETNEQILRRTDGRPGH
jgi:hypothetical protein